MASLPPWRPSKHIHAKGALLLTLAWLLFICKLIFGLSIFILTTSALLRCLSNFLSATIMVLSSLWWFMVWVFNGVIAHDKWVGSKMLLAFYFSFWRLRLFREWRGKICFISVSVFFPCSTVARSIFSRQSKYMWMK